MNKDNVLDDLDEILREAEWVCLNMTDDILDCDAPPKSSYWWVGDIWLRDIYGLDK